MFGFSWIMFSALTIGLANPIPLGSDDSIDSSTVPDGPSDPNDLTLNKASSNLGLNVDNENNPVISSIPPNASVMSNSNIVTDPLISFNVGCTTSASPDSLIDNDVQKRGSVCPTDPVSHPSTLTPAGRSKKSTTSIPNPCKFFTPNYVTCGGTEYMTSQSSVIIGGIPNCVPASVTRIPERSIFLAADEVADYCCHRFQNVELLYAAYGCIQITNFQRPRKSDADLETDMKTLQRQHYQRQNN